MMNRSHSLCLLTYAVFLADIIISSAFSLSKEPISISRRGFGSSVASVVTGSSMLLIDPSLSTAQDESTQLAPFKDQSCKFSIKVPSEWVMTEQTLPDRRKIILYLKPESSQKTLMFIAYTPTRDDFTSLGSFGVSTPLDVWLYSE